MENIKVITVCGSLRFQKQIMIESERLEFEGNCVLGLIYPTKKNKDEYTNDQIYMLNKMHKIKIGLSDSIYVVNVGGYIGSTTKTEIEYAKSLNKEILYFEPITN